MMKRLLLLLLCVLLLTACWDYRGLNEQTIVVGMAVDMEENGDFALTFEILDLNADDGGAFRSVLLEGRGVSLAEAIHNATISLHNNMYFGMLDVLIISREMAQEHGISALVYYMTRSQNARNSMHLVVAATDRAADLLRPADEEGAHAQNILSTTLGENLSISERGGTTTTDPRALFEIFDALQTDGASFSMPVIREGEGQDIPFMLDGLAVFNGAQMIGAIEQTDMSAYLLATNNVHGRVFGADIGGERLTIWMIESSPSLHVRRQGESLHFYLDVSVEADVLSLPMGWQSYQSWIEEGLRRELGEKLSDFIARMQTAGLDALGFSEIVRRRYPQFWAEKADDWVYHMQNSTVTVDVQVEIRNFGMIGG